MYSPHFLSTCVWHSARAHPNLTKTVQGKDEFADDND